MDITWVTAFVDRPVDHFDDVREFWRRVTATTMSTTRGADAEFATFVPDDGDPILKIQKVADGPGGGHLDLHVEDPRAFAATAVTAGAVQRADLGDVVVLESPGGLGFCAVPPRVAGVRPSPVGEQGARTLVDQVSIDVAPDRFDAECAFWAALTGWPLRAGYEPEYAGLVTPDDQPFRFLLQRRGEDAAGQPAECHLDLACDDVDAAVEQHLELGGELVERFRWWTVMADPGGTRYCLTRRDPDTGRPAEATG